jgi:hypothetical protein
MSAWLLGENKKQLEENSDPIIAATTLFHVETKEEGNKLANLLGISKIKESEFHLIKKEDIRFKKIKEAFKIEDLRLLRRLIKKKFELSFIMV